MTKLIYRWRHGRAVSDLFLQAAWESVPMYVTPTNSPFMKEVGG